MNVREISLPEDLICVHGLCVCVCVCVCVDVCPLTASIAVTSDHSPSNQLKVELTELFNKHRRPQRTHTKVENFKETIRSPPPFHQLCLFIH